MLTRVCTKCNEVKLLDEFYTRESRCKHCVRLIAKENKRRNNPELVEKEKLLAQGKRRCKKCSQIKELTTENFPQTKTSKGEKIFRHKCKVCYGKERNTWRREKRSDPEYRRTELDKEKARRAKIIAARDKDKIAARKREQVTGLRICNTCGEKKPFSEYQKNGIGSKGQQLYDRKCTKCTNVRIQKWRIDNYEERFNYRKSYRQENYEKIKSRSKKYYNSEEGKKKRLEYHEKNKPIRNKKLVEKRKNDPVEALAHNLRSRTAHAFSDKGYTKRSKTYTYLGISFEELKEYIENKFKEGMSWENREEWHIDHIIPLAAANNKNELIAFCYHKNLEIHYLNVILELYYL